MLWIAIAAQVSAPMPTNLPRWFGYDDLPAYMIEREPGHWLVGVRITVGPDGTVHGCDVESGSGTERLDGFTCRRIRQRAEFVPAREADGSLALGVYRTSISWAVADSPFDSRNVSIPDVDVSVANLPAGLRSPALVRVMFAVDAQGKISSCAAEPAKSFELVSNSPELVPVACSQLEKIYKPVPARDSAGAAIPSVQDAIVRFSVASQAAR